MAPTLAAGAARAPAVALELCGVPAALGGAPLQLAGWRSRLAVHERLGLTAAGAEPGDECGGRPCDEFLSLWLPHGLWTVRLSQRSAIASFKEAA